MLVGPFPARSGRDSEALGERAGHELLNVAPSRWYLTGFPVPETDERSGSVEAGKDLDDELGPRSDQLRRQSSR